MMSRLTHHLCLISILTLTLTGCVADREELDSSDTAGQPSGSDAGSSGDSAAAGPLDGGLPADVAVSTITDLQMEAEELGCDGNSIQTLKTGVAVEGVVVTAAKFDAYTSDDGSMGLDGYYVGDMEMEEWSGIMIVVDRASGTDFQVGDLLDLTGDLEEYYCMTQIGVTGYAKVGDASTPTAWNVAAEDAGGEIYEGMLVRVEGVTVESQDDYGNSTVTGGLLIGDEFDVYADLTVGETYDVTGIVATLVIFTAGFGASEGLRETDAESEVVGVAVEFLE